MNDVTTAPAKQLARTPTDLSPMGWIRNEIDRLFEDFGGPSRSLFFNPRIATPSPAMELVEGDKDYRLSVELPGSKPEQVDISVADGVLSISGEKKEEHDRKENGYLLSERSYGSFRREVAVPADVDPGQIKARFADGVLQVTMIKDKAASPRTRKIAIEK